MSILGYLWDKIKTELVTSRTEITEVEVVQDKKTAIGFCIPARKKRQIGFASQPGDMADDLAPEPIVQPRDWQECKSQSFALAAKLGITIGQTARGAKTLSYNGQVREYDSWMGIWTALTQGR